MLRLSVHPFWLSESLQGSILGPDCMFFPCKRRLKPSELPGDIERSIYDVSARMRDETANGCVVSLLQEPHLCCFWQSKRHTPSLFCMFHATVLLLPSARRQLCNTMGHPKIMCVDTLTSQTWECLPVQSLASCVLPRMMVAAIIGGVLS